MNGFCSLCLCQLCDPELALLPICEGCHSELLALPKLQRMNVCQKIAENHEREKTREACASVAHELAELIELSRRYGNHRFN